MTINYKKLYSNGLLDSDFIILQKVFQKESTLLENDIERFEFLEELGLVDFVKGKDKWKTIRLSKKGLTFFKDLLVLDLTEDVSALLKELMDLYEANGRNTGTKLDVQDRLLWFIGNTGFSEKAIYEMVETHIDDSGEFTMNLTNLIWKPQSTAFSIHKNLKNSVLYDMFSKKYKLNDDMFINPSKSVEMDWMADIGRLKVSKKFDEEMFFTGSFQGDSDHILKVKKEYLKRIKR